VDALPITLTERQGKALLDGLREPASTVRPRFPRPSGASSALAILAKKWPPAQAPDAFDMLVEAQLSAGGDPWATDEVGRGLQALASRLPAATVAKGYERLLKGMKSNPDPEVKAATFSLFGALAPQLPNDVRDAVVNELWSTIRSIGPPNGWNVLRLVQSLLSLRPKLAGPELNEALSLAKRHLARATTPEEAEGWVQAIASLSSSQSDDVALDTFLEILKYPTVAGRPTDALLAALRKRFSDAPAPEDGVRAAAAWFASRRGVDAVSRAPKEPADVPSN
jgi:hypothetical protein